LLHERDGGVELLPAALVDEREVVVRTAALREWLDRPLERRTLAKRLQPAPGTDASPLGTAVDLVTH